MRRGSGEKWDIFFELTNGICSIRLKSNQLVNNVVNIGDRRNKNGGGMAVEW